MQQNSFWISWWFVLIFGNWTSVQLVQGTKHFFYSFFYVLGALDFLQCLLYVIERNFLVALGVGRQSAKYLANLKSVMRLIKEIKLCTFKVFWGLNGKQNLNNFLWLKTLLENLSRKHWVSLCQIKANLYLICCALKSSCTRSHKKAALIIWIPRKNCTSSRIKLQACDKSIEMFLLLRLPR